MEEEHNKAKSPDFGEEVSKMLPLIMREFTRRQKDIFSKGLLTVPQVVILDFLTERGSCKMNELAKILDLTMSAVTSIIDKMIKLRLVKRERSSEDRRVVNIIILSKGKEIITGIKEGRQNFINEFFSVLTEDEKSEYIRILGKVYNNLRQGQ